MILSIESGTEVCSIGLSREGKSFASCESVVGRDHARLVALYADQLMRENGVEPSDLEAVAVSQGPGSYTGLRIGVSFAKGICYSLSIPLIGINSLEALAHQASAIVGEGDDNVVICPMIDARRMEVYAQLFDSKMCALGEPQAVVVDDNTFADLRSQGRRLILCGDGAAKAHEVIGGELIDVMPSAGAVGELAYRKYKEQAFEDVAYFEPFYLKEATVTVSKRKYF